MTLGDSVNSKSTTKKTLTDSDVRKKAVKLVVAHIKKKINRDFSGSEHIKGWLEEMDKVLEKETFDRSEYIEMRKQLNDVIERTMDDEMRIKLRDSWYSFGRALDKKAKRRSY